MVIQDHWQTGAWSGTGKRLNWYNFGCTKLSAWLYGWVFRVKLSDEDDAVVVTVPGGRLLSWAWSIVIQLNITILETGL